MTVKDIVSKMENGAAHVILYEDDTGRIILKTIWYNEIPKKYLVYEVETITVKDYEIRLGVRV
jgi:hypothetical protein